MRNYEIKILVIDDNPQIHDDFRKIFAPKNKSSLENEEEILFGKKIPEQNNHYYLDFALQGQEGFKLVEKSIKDKKPYAVAFVDIRIPPGWDGVETIENIWKVDDQIQTVICTAYSDYTWEDIFAKFGETDRLFILKKPFDNIEVRQIVSTLVKKWLLNKKVAQKKIRDDIDRKHLEAQLSYQKTHDILTGLHNRKLFLKNLEQKLKNKSNQQSAILFFDIDKLKLINDSLGRSIADKLLINFAERIKKYIKKTDLFARDIGDEFLVYIDDIPNKTNFLTAAKRLISDLTKPFDIDGNNLNIRISVGISIFPNDGVKAETLLNSADLAMHRAKELGGNNFQFYRASMNFKADERLKLSNDLALALENKELLLYYQPLYDLKQKTIVGIEALVRWRHPKRGLLKPDEFIPVAEETSLIIPIGEWIIHSACEQLKNWHEKGLKNIWVSINISPKQFKQSDILKTIKTAIKKTNIDPKYICLEVTESLMVDEPKKIKKIITELSNLGITIAIDDFGMGYSNLNYITRMPITKLKIDKFFMRNLLTNENDQAVVLTILKLAKDLKIKALAEGVDTLEKLKFLQKNGCDEVQGFLISKPVDAISCERILINHSDFLKKINY